MRRAEGLTQTELARRIGRSKSWVSRRLSGAVNLTLASISDLARGMGFRPMLDLTPYEQLAGANRLSVPTGTEEARRPAINLSAGSRSVSVVQLVPKAA
jgi:transcriptional regulator with XRE-family HTH domain